MYIEQLSINQYYKAHHIWDNLPDDEKWEEPEPGKPLCLLIEESEREEELFAATGIAPDILSG